MATHNFQIFDESMTDTMTDIDYQTDSQRTNGVIPGVADPLLHNKLYRQCSVMAYAIAQTIVAPHGLQHARLPYPSPTPGAYSNSCPLSW